LTLLTPFEFADGTGLRIPSVTSLHTRKFPSSFFFTSLFPLLLLGPPECGVPMIPQKMIYSPLRPAVPLRVIRGMYLFTLETPPARLSSEPLGPVFGFDVSPTWQEPFYDSCESSSVSWPAGNFKTVGLGFSPKIHNPATPATRSGLPPLPGRRFVVL